MDTGLSMTEAKKSENKTGHSRYLNKKHLGPIGTGKVPPEQLEAFKKAHFTPKWANHPIKEKILKWVEEGISAVKIVERIKLQATVDNVPVADYQLSLPTVCKIKRRHIAALGISKTSDTQSVVEAITKRKQTEAEVVLWKTIRDCESKKKDPTITPKDWQYFDQQQQSALTLLKNYEKEGKSGEDISIALTRIFAEFFKRFDKVPERPEGLPSGEPNNGGSAENPVI